MGDQARRGGREQGSLEWGMRRQRRKRSDSLELVYRGTTQTDLFILNELHTQHTL